MNKPINYTKRYYIIMLSVSPIVPLVMMASTAPLLVSVPVVAGLMIAFVYAGYVLGLRDAGRGS